MRKVICFLLVICMMIPAVPVFGADISEEVLIKVKEKIDVPEDLTEFEYSEDTYDNVLRYDFYWSDKEYNHSISASSDSKGRIVNYYEYKPYDESKSNGFISYTYEDGLALAEQFIKRAYGEYTDGNDILKLDESVGNSRYYGKYKSFDYIYQRYFNGVRVNGNSVSIHIKAAKDDMYIQRVNASLDGDAVFYTGDMKNITEGEYAKKFPVRLYYATKYDNDKETVALYYELEPGFVSRVDGEIAEEEGFSRYAVTEDAAGDFGFSRMSMNSAEKKEKLTEYEKEEIDKMNSLVKPETVLKELKKYDILKITEDMVISRTNSYKRDEKYLTNFDVESDSRSMSVYYNGETGEVTSIYSYNKKYSDRSEEVKKDIPENKIKEFAKGITKNKFDETEAEFNSYDNFAEMNAVRIVNGIKFPENGINVTYDPYEEMVTDFNIYWRDDVSDFPKAEEAISYDKAEKILFEIAPLENVCINTANGYIPAVTTKGCVINAADGSQAWGYNKADKTPYTDIEGHWAEEEIKTLYEHDIYFEGGLFRPNEEITQADMVRLLYACEDYGVMPLTEAKLICEQAANDGYVETVDPEKIMTREEVFQAMLKVLGYGEVYKYDIYKTSFTDGDDFEYIGSGEILKAMGILTGDTARPKDNATRSEVAVMVYRYLAG